MIRWRGHPSPGDTRVVSSSHQPPRTAPSYLPASRCPTSEARPPSCGPHCFLGERERPRAILRRAPRLATVPARAVLLVSPSGAALLSPGSRCSVGRSDGSCQHTLLRNPGLQRGPGGTAGAPQTFSIMQDMAMRPSTWRPCKALLSGGVKTPLWKITAAFTLPTPVFSVSFVLPRGTCVGILFHILELIHTFFLLSVMGEITQGTQTIWRHAQDPGDIFICT